MTDVTCAYEGTRDICSRIGCKIRNALDDFFLNGIVNETLGIIDTASAHRLDPLSVRMEEVATTGRIWKGDWEAVRLALSLNNEFSVSKY